MNTVPKLRSRSIRRTVHSLFLFGLSFAVSSAIASPAHAGEKREPSTVHVQLDEWKVSLDPSTVPPGSVVLEVSNSGRVPHALEIEGHGIEESTRRIAPGASATLKVDLAAGTYEAYCPVGRGSHKMLGMITHLSIREPKRAATTTRDAAVKGAERDDQAYADDDDDKGEEYGKSGGRDHGELHAEMHDPNAGAGSAPKALKVVGGGPVIQILPGAFPFADSAMAVIQTRPQDQVEDLTKKAHMGPYSNNVAKITGNISLVAIDRGASGDSVSGVAEFKTKEGVHWKVVMDRAQTKDIPFNPRFGGVIMGLFYHGASNVHTPLVPTIQSSLALWAFAHLYRDDKLVTDNAMVHVMLLSRTRRTSDWALDCWDCSDRPIEELQLQVTAPPNSAPFDTPGGFLFVNWEKSSGAAVAMAGTGRAS